MKKAFLIGLQIGVLFVFSTIGLWIQQQFNLQIPGSVIGLVLLFTLLITNIIPAKWIHDGASFMTRHLILFFIPATVGLMDYFHLFTGRGFLLVVVTLLSTFIVFLTSGYVSEKVAIKKEAESNE